MNNANNEKTTSRHAATDPEKCFDPLEPLPKIQVSQEMQEVEA
jgi:hypothetical protein